mmetsp:Transcript_58524/g.154384  ORF Transcript_58524/g.154384 Transcript_58524/m.154384 type:complete len:277 (+) Transcript_58524:925-1755(+)
MTYTVRPSGIPAGLINTAKKHRTRAITCSEQEEGVHLQVQEEVAEQGGVLLPVAGAHVNDKLLARAPHGRHLPLLGLLQLPVLEEGDQRHESAQLVHLHVDVGVRVESVGRRNARAHVASGEDPVALHTACKRVVDAVAAVHWCLALLDPRQHPGIQHRVVKPLLDRPLAARGRLQRRVQRDTELQSAQWRSDRRSSSLVVMFTRMVRNITNGASIVLKFEMPIQSIQRICENCEERNFDAAQPNPLLFPLVRATVRLFPDLGVEDVEDEVVRDLL